MKKIAFHIGGGITFIMSLLHLSFWRVGNWGEELARLSPDNRGIVQMLNVVSIYTLLCAAFVTFHLAKKTSFTVMERSVVRFIAGYYLLRIAFGIPFFGISAEEVTIWIVCLIVACGYLFAIRRR